MREVNEGKEEMKKVSKISKTERQNACQGLE